MKMQFEVLVASIHFKAKRTRAFISLTTLLSVMGVGLGVMALIIVLSVMKGFEKDLSAKILQFQPHILVEAQLGPMADPEAIRESILSTKDVSDVSPYVDVQTLLKTPVGMAGVLVKGIAQEEAALLATQLEEPAFSLLFRDASDPVVILGDGIVKRLGGQIRLNEIVYLISPRGSLSPAGYMPGMKRFQMGGEFQTGVFTKDMATAYVALPMAQQLGRLGSAVSGLSVQVQDPMKAAQAARQIQADLGDAYRVNDWGKMNQSLLSALKLEQVVTFLILALVIFVAALNILGTLVMSVLEKSKDIAILKSMGVSDLQIKRIFVLNGLFVGAIGVLMGTLLGVGATMMLGQYKFISLPENLAYMGDTLPVYLDPVSVIITVVCALLICFLATLYPAKRASMMNPVEILKNG